MAETKTKKWTPPKGWASTDYDEDATAFTGTRTYPDGTTREILAHSTEEFEANAAATDEERRLALALEQDRLNAAADVAKAEAKALKEQADSLDF